MTRNNALIKSRLYELAFVENNAIAKHHVGLCYEYGIGVEKNIDQAIELYLKSAELGYSENPQSKYWIGVARKYEFEKYGDDKDIKCYLKCLKISAELGYARAQNDLGCVYMNGEYGELRNQIKAFELFKLAAEQDNSFGQLNFGRCYLHGHGVNKNINEAKFWLRKAANQSNSYAEYELAMLLLNE